MTRPRRLLPGCLLVAALCAAAIPLSAQGWTRYVARDKSFSFHYPAGWTVGEETDSVVEIDNAPADEEILVVAAPLRAKTARAVAEAMLDLFAEQMPGLEASGWRTEGGDGAAVFDMSYTEGDKPYSALGIVIRGDEASHWFSFSGPAEGFSRTRAAAVLQALVGSVAAGAGSRPPAAADPDAQAERSLNRETAGNGGAGLSARAADDLRGFLFIVELALGGPLTVAQEKVILDEMARGSLVRTEKGLRTMDQYPQLVKVIMTMGQHDLEELRSTLEAAVRQWMDENDASDPGVAAVRAAIERRGKVVVAGDPPLTEMAAQAYAELYAFAERLGTDIHADPSAVAASDVASVRRALVAAWPKFDAEARADVATSPGLWLVWRKALAFGTARETALLRSKIRGIIPEPSPADAAKEAQRRWVNHQTLMNMQQMTFNTYMWSRGYNYQPATGKMW